MSEEKEKKVGVFFSLLRVLCPEEIQSLTTISQGAERFSLTDVLCDQLTRFGALQGDLIDNVISMASYKNENGIDDRPRKVGKEEFFTENKGVVFILDIKEKMKFSQYSLRSKELHGIYKKNSEIDINLEKNNKDDLKKSSNHGVLVNKRQA